MTTVDPFAIPDPIAPTTPPVDQAPAAGDTIKPKRPTTRAERAAVSAANQAKKATASKPKDKGPAGKPAPRRASLETRLAGSIATMGTAVMVAGVATNEAVQKDGLLVVQHSGSIAAALDKVAKDDPKVAAALERMLTAGVWSGLIAALLPLGLGIAANHGMIPEHVMTMLGAGVPEAENAA